VLVDGNLLSDVLSFLLLGGFLLLGWFSFGDSLLGSILLSDGQQSSLQLLSSERLGVRVELDHETEIAEGILLVDGILLGGFLLAKVSLDLLRVDQSA